MTAAKNCRSSKSQRALLLVLCCLLDCALCSKPAVSAPRPYYEMELVVARHKEKDLSWLAKIPDIYNITVYNKGGERWPMPESPEGIQWTVISLPNVGREANTFAEHLVRRYDSLAEYTIFSQANPFVHNHLYLELLNHPEMLAPVQPMSRVYKSYKGGDWRWKTPVSVVKKMSKHPWYRSERQSTRTLNSVWYHDEGAVGISKRHHREHSISPGTNLIRRYFGLMGLPDWMPEDQEVASFAFGALVGFEKSKALQHPKQCYESLLQTTRNTSQPTNPWVVERLWVIMFAGHDYVDT